MQGAEHVRPRDQWALPRGEPPRGDAGGAALAVCDARHDRRAPRERRRSDRMDASAPQGARMSGKSRWAGIVAVSFIWGSTWLAIKIGLGSMPPFLSAGKGFAIAGGGLSGAAVGSGV